MLERARSVTVLVVALALVLTACTSKGGPPHDDATATEPPAPTSTVDVGAGVIVDAPGFQGTITAEDRDRPASLAGLDAAGTTVELTATPPELPDGATVEIPVAGAGDGETVFVMTAPDPEGPWTPIEATVSDGRARFEVQHFSWFDVVRITADFVRRVVQEVFDGFTSEVFSSAPQPTCTDEAGARADGWEISSAGPDTLKWCFGLDGDGRFVNVAANRRYPLAISAGESWAVRASRSPWALESLSEAAQVRWGAASTVLLAGEEASFRLDDLAEGATAMITTEYDGLTHVVGSIQYAAEALIAIVSRFGLNPLQGGGKALLANLVAARSCADAIAGGTGEESVSTIISRCFDAGILSQALGGGLAGIIGALVIATGGFIGFLAQTASALWDTVTSGDAYTLEVSRARPSAATPSVGECSSGRSDAAFDPEWVGGCFYVAWQSNDRSLAARYGDPAAVEAMFGYDPAEGWTFDGCTTDPNRPTWLGNYCNLRHEPAPGEVHGAFIELYFTAYDDVAVISDVGFSG